MNLETYISTVSIRIKFIHRKLRHMYYQCQAPQALVLLLSISSGLLMLAISSAGLRMNIKS